MRDLKGFSSLHNFLLLNFKFSDVREISDQRQLGQSFKVSHFDTCTCAPGKDGLQVAQRRRVEGGKHDQNWLRRGRGGLVFHFNTSAFGTMGGRGVSGRGDGGGHRGGREDRSPNQPSAFQS